MDVFVLIGLLALGTLWLFTYKKLVEVKELLIYLTADHLAIRDDLRQHVGLVLEVLERRGLLTRDDLERVSSNFMGSISKEDMDRLDMLLERDPDTYSDEDIKFLRRMGINLIRTRNKKAVELGYKLLMLAAKSEYYLALTGKRTRVERVEANYRDDICMAEVKLYRGPSVEYIEEPDMECIRERVESVRRFAEGKGDFPTAAARMYRECKAMNNASCRAFLEMLGDGDKRILETNS